MQPRRRTMLIILGVLLAAAAIVKPATAAVREGTARSVAGPSASELLDRVAQGCETVSGEFATDEGEPPSVAICRAGNAFVWTADMDIDCDGIETRACNQGTDEAFQAQTSFETSQGNSFQADRTRFFVIPLPSERFDYEQAGITPGSVAAVIFEGKVVYAVFADEGPADIIGEASFATAKALGIDPDPSNGGVEDGVTYIVFPRQVPNQVENNAAINRTGIAAATAFVRS